MVREKSMVKVGVPSCRTFEDAGPGTPHTYVTFGWRCAMIPVKMLPACCTEVLPTAEFMWLAASHVAVLTPACMACATAESPARLFMEDGFVLVSASCVFSRCSSCVVLLAVIMTCGMRDFETGAAAALCSGLAADVPPPLPLFEAAIIAFNSVSVTPALCSRTSSAVDVLN